MRSTLDTNIWWEDERKTWKQMKNWSEEYEMNQEIGWRQKKAGEDKKIQEGGEGEN